MKKFIAILFFVFAAPLWARDIGITQWVTPYGVRVLFLAAKEIPMVDLSIDVDAGTRWDPVGKTGLADITQGMLDKGIKAHGAELAMTETQVSEALAELAVQKGGSVGLDRASVSVRMLSDQEVRTKTAKLLSRMMAYPEFNAEILDREKKRSIAAIKESMTQPQAIATKALWKSVYGQHPYGNEPTPESIAGITPADLTGFHQQAWQANRMRVTIVGAMTEAEARALVDQLFEFFPKTPATPISPIQQQPTVMGDTSPRRQAISHPAAQAHVWLGMPGITRNDPDFFALTVGNYIFGGGGFVSRLTSEIREKRGLSYSVFSAFSPLAQPGPFMISLQTQSAKAPEALKVVEDTLRTFLKEGPTEKEIKAAKQNLVGGFALRVDTNRKLLDNLAQINYYDMPLNYLQTWTSKVSAVTRDDIIRAMNRAVRPDKLSVVVVAGPAGFQP